ncbi:serine/threonine protein kinase [Pseudohyphozyma bogoriensis]|nr:serine/threonine protein kinase [Pseudohyphozyma bogoriensis]
MAGPPSPQQLSSARHPHAHSRPHPHPTPFARPQRSASSTRISELGWTPPPSLPVALESTERVRQNDAYRAWTKHDLAAQPAYPLTGRRRASKGKGKGKARSKAKAFVVGAPSSGSGEEGDVERVEQLDPAAADLDEDDDEDEGPLLKELSVEEIIRWQIRQPIQTVDSQDLDSLLPLGISDYTYITNPNPPKPTSTVSTPTSPIPSSSKSPPSSPSSPATPEPEAPNRVVLGKGKFSEVLLVRKGDVDYALKHTPLHPHHPLIATRLLREPTILAQLLPHPNLVRVYETVRTPGHFYLVEENLSESITLESLVSNSPGGVLPVELAWSVLDQLSSVVRSLHEPLRVCHRDIKPENMVVRVTPNEDPSKPPTLLLKLLDFGLATHYSSSEPKLTTCCGSPAYHSPELWRSLREPSGSVKYWGPEVDIWCVGLTLLRCLTPTKYPLGISHSSIFALSDKVVDAMLAIEDEPMRRALAPLMQMDGTKRMRAFERFCESRESIYKPNGVEVPTIPIVKKEFKSTTFIPTERVYSLDLPVSPTTGFLSPLNHHVPLTTKPLSRSPSRSRNTSRPRPSRQVSYVETDPTPVAELSNPGSVVSLPSLTPDASPFTNETAPLTPRSFSRDRSSPPPIEIVLLNPTDEPIRRAASYIKYALRCAGILYHVRDNLYDSAFSSVNPSCNASDEDDSTYVCQLQCVIKLPGMERQSKASSALIAALRPPITRAHTTGAPVRSSSTPPTGKGKGDKKKEEVKALTFFLSVRKAPNDHEDVSYAPVGVPSHRRGESQSRRGKKRRSGDEIVITLSDDRALQVVKQALKIEESPVPTDSEDRGRGRHGSLSRSDQLKPSRIGSGSREARDRRARHTPVPEEAEGLGLAIAPGEKKLGFFDYVATKFPVLSRQSSAVNTPTATTPAPVTTPAAQTTSSSSEDDRRAQALGAAVAL